MEKGMKKVCYAAGLALSAVWFSACSFQRPEETTSLSEIPVRVIVVDSSREIRTTSYVGTVNPIRSIVLSAKYPGTLVSLSVSQGDYVKKGQVLAEIESAAVKSSFDMAQATLRQAEDGFARVKQVHGSGTIADVKMVEVETQVKKARSAARAARQALEDCKLIAPFDGVVGEVYYTQGVEVSLLEPVLRVMDVSDLEIDFPVPEKEIGSIQVGDTVEIKVPALNDTIFNAAVTSKGMVASALSHSYTCKAHPDSSISGLLPGMVGKVYLNQDSRPGVVIPSDIVQMDAKGKYVWIVNDDNSVERRYIGLDGFSGKGVVVASGLEPGVRLIVEGSRKVSTGMRVKVIE